MTDDISRTVERKLTDEHAAYLEAAAIDLDLARALGVHSLLSHHDSAALNDSNWANFANFPSIVFPWTNEDGGVMYQARPDNPTQDQKTGKPRKYVFGRGAGSILWAVRPIDTAERIVIIEGTKQCLAAASHAPPGVGIYGIAGIRNWQVNGQPIADLAAADGREVVVIPDADAATNPQVYQACLDFGQALVLEGATKVLFGRLSGGQDKSGLDDTLASRKPERRAALMARIIDSARPKPADAKPKPQKRNGTAPGEDGRPTLICNRDRLAVINDLTGALLAKGNAKTLFNHGGVISRLGESGMSPVDKGSFHDLVQETVMTVNENEGMQGTTYTFSWPDAGTMSATMSRAPKFAPLERIVHAPFVRPDGTIATEPGYDEPTRTLLLPDPVFQGLTVPENPSAAEIVAARELLLTEWMGDFPLDAEPDRANLLGLLVTPAIRGMVPRAPLAVIDGLQMGVGKNLLADCLLTVYTGHAAQPMNMVDEHEELRKQITAAFRTGAEFFVFDEAHTLQGAPLAQALTAETWQDRILGVSTMANFPNRVTWVSLGNNVQVKGDITRRVYRIALRPTYANPQDRAASSFRHPGQSGLDLASWTRKHRRELLTAILTLVRAWFAQGSPHPKRGVSFGSFETWERTVGGIVETAGLPGFLGNLKVWRSESDFDSQYWTGHLTWLREQFGEKPFKTADVRNKALTVGDDFYPAPPRLDEPKERTYGKALGEAYSRLRGRRYNGLWIERVSSSHGHVALWQVHEDGDLPPAPGTDEPPPWNEPDDACPACGRLHYPWCKPDDTEVSSIVHGEAPGLLGEMERALAGEGLDVNGDPQAVDGPVDGARHAGADGSCPDYGSRLDPCPPGCASGECVYAAPKGQRVEDAPTVGLVTLDLETGDAGALYKRDEDYVRLAGVAIDDGPVQVEADDRAPNLAVNAVRSAEVLTGHNVMAFDLPALVRYAGLTMTEVHAMAADGRLADGMIIGRYLDPPMARDKGVDQQRKYDLGVLAAKYGAGEKLTDISKKLAEKYGGWDNIPTAADDPDGALFRQYLVGDVEASRKLHARLLEELGGSLPDYLLREHRVAAIAAQISTNGFLVDQELLAERVAGVNRRKAESMQLLSGKYGIPTADAKGKPYLSPLASKAGKEALGAALMAAGVPEKALWRTEKSKDLQVSSDAMLHYGREYGAHSAALREICKAVYRIVSARSIYETTQNTMCPDGRVHPKIGFDQATGRWSLTRPGLTVFGKREGRHVERAVLLADPGEALVAFDLAQVDMRGVAGHSQDQAYIEMLKSEDPHSELALALFGSRDMRETAKPIGHGWNYGESLKRISMSNNIEPRLVVQFDHMMRERFARLVEWREEIRAIAASGQLLDNGFGRLMRPDPQRAHTQGPALMGQGAARDLMMTGMVNIADRVPEALPMLRAQVHDEIVLSIPLAQVEEISRAVVECLSFEWRGVPILADRSPAGSDWSLCYVKS